MTKDEQINQARNDMGPMTHYAKRYNSDEIIPIYCGSTSGHTRNICGFISQAEYREKVKYISWHLFGDGWDEYYPTKEEAEIAYGKADSPNLRLYKEISYDDDAPDEEYIKGRGNFPW